MNLKRNILANYGSQAYVAAVGILTVPLYVSYMGTEAYGLIGFYALMQAWFQLLDAGLSTTLARESARFSGGGAPARNLLQLRNVMEMLFLVFASVAVVGFALAADSVVTRWLKVSTLPIKDVITCVQLMGVVVAGRWMSCLYRGVITGFEQQVWLSGFNTVIASLRFVACLPLVALIDNRPATYFAYQAVVAIVEAIWLYRQAGKLMPTDPQAAYFQIDWDALRPTLRFASGVAFTSVVWVLVTQVDKLAMSNLLPLAHYGEYTLAVLLAGGISLLGGPIGTALLPRLTNSVAAGDAGAVADLYMRYTQIVCLITVPVAVTFYAMAPEILLAWTGNAALAQSAAPVLGLYSLGNAVLGITAFAYYIQYARGDIRLHLIGNALFVVVYLPAVLLAARYHGAPGAGLAWLVMNVCYLLLWVPVIHRRMMPGQHTTWVTRNVLPVVVAASLPCLLLAWLPRNATSRWESALLAAVFFVFSLGLGLLASDVARTWVTRRLRVSLA